MMDGGQEAKTELLVYYPAMLNGSIRNDGLVELVTHSALLGPGGGLGRLRGMVFADPVWRTTHFYASQEGTMPNERMSPMWTP
jgi:hypothetical protein